MRNTICRRVGCGLFAVSTPLIAGCWRNTEHSPQAILTPTTARSAASSATAGNPKTGKHQTAHGGVLNAIVKCEIGHVEAKKETDRLCIWFVNGTPDTTKSVPIKDSKITLKIMLPGEKTSHVLTLNPQPLELAGETVGKCSRFTGRAPWLFGVTTFTATGNITFKGQKQPLRIEYPNGYDPD